MKTAPKIPDDPACICSVDKAQCPVHECKDSETMDKRDELVEWICSHWFNSRGTEKEYLELAHIIRAYEKRKIEALDSKKFSSMKADKKWVELSDVLKSLGIE